MPQPFPFYSDQLKKHETDLSAVKKQLFTSSMLRVMVFCLGVVGIYLTFGDPKMVFIIFLLAAVLFLFLVSRHTDLKYRGAKLQALIGICETEVKALNHDFHSLPEGNEFKDPQHYFSEDIDLFGRGSFYQYVNRTALKQGSETLASLLTENAIENIAQKQQAVRELAGMPEWRQEFTAIASLTRTEITTNTIVKWLGSYSGFVPFIMKYLPLVFSLVSISLIVFFLMALLPLSYVLLWFFLGLGISVGYAKGIKKLISGTSNMEDLFKQYHRLLTILEQTNFKSELLLAQKHQILGDHRSSKLFRVFSEHLNSLDKNINPFYLLFANGFFLRSLTHCYLIESWIRKHGASVEKWFNVIAFFDAYNSLGNFAFNHPKYSFPAISNGHTVLKASGLGHPLLHPDKSILNDFEIENQEFFIITGANMAGKSTFLRTVSLQIVMANVGLPLCASKAEYGPIKLITSMRTSDSLTDDESYFFSELKRLKFIVNEIQTDRYFIVLDEILKGTNSIDKAKGSKKFVARLVASNSTGLIATHDLSLCEIAKEMPQIENYYFDAEIIKGDLHFDYTFKNGICKNMNASFLLKKMGIV
jgi:DNA mismatch repair ATPase MutS